MPQKILITYFGAFEGVAENPTASLTRELQLWAHAELPDTRLITAELPVIFGESRTDLSRVLERERPDAVISLGVAVGRDKVSLERVAINCDDARLPITRDTNCAIRLSYPALPRHIFPRYPSEKSLTKQKSAISR